MLWGAIATRCCLLGGTRMSQNDPTPPDCGSPVCQRPSHIFIVLPPSKTRYQQAITVAKRYTQLVGGGPVAAAVPWYPPAYDGHCFTLPVTAHHVAQCLLLLRLCTRTAGCCTRGGCLTRHPLHSLCS